MVHACAGPLPFRPVGPRDVRGPARQGLVIPDPLQADPGGPALAVLAWLKQGFERVAQGAVRQGLRGQKCLLAGRRDVLHKGCEGPLAEPEIRARRRQAFAKFIGLRQRGLALLLALLAWQYLGGVAEAIQGPGLAQGFQLRDQDLAGAQGSFRGVGSDQQGVADVR